MSDMKAYLAEKYMSGPKADAILSRSGPPKKKKRKKDPSASAAGSTSIKDDDGGWIVQAEPEEPDEGSTPLVASDRAFKTRKTGWTTIQGKEPSPPPAADEQPQVVEDTPFSGGLVSAKQLKKHLPQNQTSAPGATSAEEIALAQQTVYRDTSGRKIDTKAAKAEAARQKREKEEKESQKMEWGKGMVQRDEQEKRKKELESMRTKGFRRADDESLNEELKTKELWNDPAAAFLSKKKSKGPRKPEYSGPPPPPNRFGIKPGYRWDGVDRGNGFEKKYFQSLNERKRRGADSHQWAVEDM